MIKMVLALMYCDRLHGWWSTQTRLTPLLSTSIESQWVETQTL